MCLEFAEGPECQDPGSSQYECFVCVFIGLLEIGLLSSGCRAERTPFEGSFLICPDLDPAHGGNPQSYSLSVIPT